MLKIIFDDAKRAVAVKYFVKETNEVVVARARKEIILSAGSYGTPQLLQVSGVGDPALLANLGVDIIANNTGKRLEIEFICELLCSLTTFS